MRRHPLIALLFFSLVLGAAALFLWEPLRQRFVPAPPPSRPRPVREFHGRIEAAGKPLPAARVELYEDAPRGYSRLGVTAADGTFRIPWIPTAANRVDRLFVAAEDADGRFARTVRPVGDAASIDLLPRVTVHGRVIDMAGAAVEDARILACVRNDRRVVPGASDGEGGFVLEGMPAGAPLILLVARPGLRTLVESRFRAGDFLTLRMRRGLAVQVDVHDPAGSPVPDVDVRLAVPDAFAEFAPRGDEAVLNDASAGGACLVRVEAPGHLPVELPAVPQVPARIVLWPARSVLVKAWDAREKTGVDGAAFDVVIQPEGGTAPWMTDKLEAVSRPFRVRYSERVGEYQIRLPLCPVVLSCTAPGYEDATVTVPAAAAEASLRMVAQRNGSAGTIVVRAGRVDADLPLAVADEQGGWYQPFDLVGGEAEVTVPAGRTLQVASLVAADGLWVPKLEVAPLVAGERRVVAVGLRRALRLEVRTEPPVQGEATLVDVAHEKIAPPQRAPIEEGVARFWVRPLRSLRVRVQPDGNFLEREGELLVEQEDRSWLVQLRAGAGIRYVVRDRPGHPVPFAAARLWESNAQGRVDLRMRPRSFASDATGTLLMEGLDAESAALEIRAPGFRTLRLANVRLETESVLERGGLILDLATALEGRVVGPDGEPVHAAWVKVLEPEVARIGSSEIELDAYHLDGGDGEEAATGPDGRFEVLDASARSPLLAVSPSGRPDLAAMAFEIVEGEGTYALLPAAYLELDVPGSVAGVFRVFSRGRAVRIKDDPAVSLRPLPVVVPAGRTELFVLLRSGEWAAPIVELKPGETQRIKPEFRR